MLKQLATFIFFLVLVGCSTTEPNRSFFYLQTEAALQTGAQKSKEAEESVTKLRQNNGELDEIVAKLRSLSPKLAIAKKECDRPLVISVHK